ncbi:MAG: hypothetical protein PVI23_12695 [Maricaulaceae bacterium]|jgi:hypothetical protein
MRIATIFLALAATGAGAAAHAQPAAPTTLQDCARITSDEERLACFDRLANGVDAAVPATPSAPVVQPSPPVAQPDPEESFGFAETVDPLTAPTLEPDPLTAPTVASASSSTAETAAAPPAPPRPEDIDSIHSDIVRVDTFGYDRLRFYLANGQVWDQIEYQRMRVNLDRSPVAEIRRAAMGSFLLQVDGRGPATRVRRIR